MSQGANPWSDLGCREALRLIALYLARAVRDAGDIEAREHMMWAATLAGIAFGNAGVHVPHAMAYAIAYGLHTLEMSALRGWGVAFLASVAASTGAGSIVSPTTALTVLGLMGTLASLAGNEAAIRFGRRRLGIRLNDRTVDRDRTRRRTPRFDSRRPAGSPRANRTPDRARTLRSCARRDTSDTCR